MSSDVLHCVGIRRVRLEWTRRVLDPHSTNESYAVPLDESQDPIEHANRVGSLSVARGPHRLPQVGSLYLSQNGIEAGGDGVRVEATLQTEEVCCEGCERGTRDDKSREQHQRRSAWVRIGRFGSARFVYVADVHGPKRSYGRPRAAVGGGVRPGPRRRNDGISTLRMGSPRFNPKSMFRVSLACSAPTQRMVFLRD